ncbi:TonB-dependent receptor plug domain-containing protein [Spartinivicinus poritis]|uniref:TonB-dependent receptor n=1 Tax=Spartinivicinus poritis TaxID=2994640 RepID=A0ABT5U752_9GAMM|nr:TonB-dependent receptor [Spartinivicinus sp. A2-2]MDE1462191.1 TonB-dependent receptor [Spartinivicinus sp. A2-2]
MIYWGSQVPTNQRLLCLLLSFVLPCHIEASEDNGNELLELELEELLAIEVSVASVKPENITNTPAVVSSYTIKDLEKLGIRSLRDVIAFIPGFVLERSRAGLPQVLVRGSTVTFGAKLLVMLDGVPIWSPSHSNIPLFGIPWASIEKVEAIRGPGAVIYGSNAIAGVLNVITKQQDEGVLQASAASNDSLNTTGFYRHSFSNDSAVAFGFERQHKDDGFDAEAFSSSINASPAEYQQKELFESIFLRYQHDSGQVLFSYFNDFIEGSSLKGPPRPMPGMMPPMPGGMMPGPMPAVIVTNKTPDNKTESLLVHSDYSFSWENHSLMIYGDYNQYAPTFFAVGETGQFDDVWRDNFRIRAGIRGEGQLVEWVDYLVGIESELRKIDDFRNINKNPNIPAPVLLRADDVREDSVYGQLDFHQDQWRFLMGARASDNERSGFKVTPRTSLIYSFDGPQSLKLLYSVGFTSPNFDSAMTQDGGIVDAETIEMVDFVYSYVTTNTLFAANLYYYKGEDFITRDLTAPTPTPAFLNSDSFRRKGLELDYQVQMDKTRLHFNVAYNHEGNKTTISDDPLAALVPELTLNMGAHYRLGNHLFGMNYGYISRRQVADRSNGLSVNYQYTLGEFEFFISIHNLLEDEFFSVEPDRGDSFIAIQRKDNGVNYKLGFKINF